MTIPPVRFHARGTRTSPILDRLVREAIQDAIKWEGRTISDIARDSGLSYTFVWGFLNGKCGIGFLAAEVMLSAIGMRFEIDIVLVEGERPS